MRTIRQRNLLGMEIGKANHRLRKAIMFDMANKLGLLRCFRCQQPILEIDQFTIDHKEAWQRADNPAEAFFSLENIAFSHPRCNLDAAVHYRKYATKEEARLAKNKQARSPEYLTKKKEWRRKKRAELRKLGLPVT